MKSRGLENEVWKLEARNRTERITESQSKKIKLWKLETRNCTESHGKITEESRKHNRKNEIA